MGRGPESWERHAGLGRQTDSHRVAAIQPTNGRTDGRTDRQTGRQKGRQPGRLAGDGILASGATPGQPGRQPGQPGGQPASQAGSASQAGPAGRPGSSGTTWGPKPIYRRISINFWIHFGVHFNRVWCKMDQKRSPNAFIDEFE